MTQRKHRYVCCHEKGGGCHRCWSPCRRASHRQQINNDRSVRSNTWIPYARECIIINHSQFKDDVSQNSPLSIFVANIPDIHTSNNIKFLSVIYRHINPSFWVRQVFFLVERRIWSVKSNMAKHRAVNTKYIFKIYLRKFSGVLNMLINEVLFTHIYQFIKGIIILSGLAKFLRSLSIICSRFVCEAQEDNLWGRYQKGMSEITHLWTWSESRENISKYQILQILL